MSERFHPDAFADWEVGDLNDLLLSVQEKVSAAHRVLSTEEKRRQYLSFLLLKFELAGVRSPGIVLDAELALKRGERALRARRHDDAVAALRQAAELNPREPEYLAMLGLRRAVRPRPAGGRPGRSAPSPPPGGPWSSTPATRGRWWCWRWPRRRRAGARRPARRCCGPSRPTPAASWPGGRWPG